MKVLLINGSSHKNGCTDVALNQVAKTLNTYGIDTEVFWIGTNPIRDCVACGGCARLDNRCVFGDDPVNKILEKAQECDGFIFGSPVYYAHPSGRLLSVLDRCFYAGVDLFRHKPAAAVVSARRAGTTASIDAINKHITFAEMILVGSSYWNMVHGSKAEDVLQDREGLQIMENLGYNMAWILRCIEAGKKAGIQIPDNARSERTNFIR